MRENIPAKTVHVLDRVDDAGGSRLPDEVVFALADISEIASECLLALSVEAGLAVLGEMMEAECTVLCGLRNAKDPDRRFTRNGTASMSVVLGERKVTIRRPRVKSTEGSPAPKLASLTEALSKDLLTHVVMERILAGVSARKYTRANEPMSHEVAESGTDESNNFVSRQFISGTGKALSELLDQDLSELEIAVLMIDGVALRSETFVVAVAITIDGTKIPIGLRHCNIEDKTLVTAMLVDLVDRGLDYSGGLLVTIDTAEALATAVREVFGDLTLIDRCQLHKQRNIEGHLPKSERSRVHRSLAEAFNHPDPEQGLVNARQIATELDNNWPDAADSIREDLEDIFTVQRLEVTGTLLKTLGPTTPTQTTTPTQVTTTPAQMTMDPSDKGLRKTKSFRSSWRLRLLGWYMALLAIATIATLVVLQSVLLLQFNRSIDARLTQEVEELRVMATGINPETGELFGTDTPAVMNVFLANNVPDTNETFVTYLNGVPFLRSVNAPPLRLDLDPSLTALWADVTETSRGVVQTAEGEVDFVAVPLLGGEDHGVFVAAIFSDIERGEAHRPIFWAAVTEGVVGIAIAGILAWMLTARIVRPVSRIAETARSISGKGLSQRVPVSSDDELGELAATFNEMLDRLDDSFTMQQTFLADAGHELRTPITVIRGHLELIDRNPEQSAATIQVVTEELDRMARMVDDLLTLARAEHPDFLRHHRVDIDDLTTAIFGKVASLGARTWVLDDVALDIAELDGQRVTQAMIALADNAVGHTEEGDEIGIGSHCSGDEVKFWVRDTGPGVPEEDRPGLFERFQRGATSRDRSGAGLGLSIVNSIAVAHGGTVQLSSEEGQGSTFTLLLPLAPRQEDPS